MNGPGRAPGKVITMQAQATYKCQTCGRVTHALQVVEDGRPCFNCGNEDWKYQAPGASRDATQDPEEGNAEPVTTKKTGTCPGCGEIEDVMVTASETRLMRKHLDKDRTVCKGSYREPVEDRDEPVDTGREDELDEEGPGGLLDFLGFLRSNVNLVT